MLLTYIESRLCRLTHHTDIGDKGASLDPSYNMLICGSKPDDWIISGWAGEEADIGILSVWWAARRSLCSLLLNSALMNNPHEERLLREGDEQRLPVAEAWSQGLFSLSISYCLPVSISASLSFPLNLNAIEKGVRARSWWREWKLHLLFEHRNFSCWKTDDYHNLSTCSRDTLSRASAAFEALRK